MTKKRPDSASEVRPLPAAGRVPPAKVAWSGRLASADRRFGISDPMKITYLLVMDEERFDRMTVYQGFGRGWEPLLWAMRELVELPASVLEPAWPMEGLIGQRMGGANHQAWMPLMASALEQLVLDEIGFCTVIFTGTDASARRVSAWIAKQPRPVLHVSTKNVAGTMSAGRFDFEALREHCLAVYGRHSQEISPDRAEAALRALENWKIRETISIDLDEIGHNSVTPNHMVLRRAFRTLGAQHPNWMSVKEEDYTRVIVESARAVIAVRNSIPSQEWRRLYIPWPAIILTEPAMFRHAYARGKPDSKLAPATLMMIRRMQRQQGLAQSIEKKQVAMLTEGDGQWQMAVGERQIELVTQTVGIGLYAAQSCSVVVRLRPEVNRLFPRLSEYARNVRAVNPNARNKAPQILRRAQDAIARAVGPERIGLIKDSGGPIKIVSDAPLELLPIDGLPLSLRYDTSRINATPGNLMMGELISRPPITILHDDITHILVISAFSEDDPLRDEMANAIEALHKIRPGRFRIDFVRVGSVEEFVSALNATEAPIVVFDGHGTQDNGEGVGGLYIGSKPVDVWSLRARTHSPPIVILSACDTHGLDAPSHATAANSFIALGATTVLGTLLPVGGHEGAVFVYRLLLHLADFVPAAITAGGRALSWTEIMAGALRLTVSKDILDHLEKQHLINPEDAGDLFHNALVAVLEGGPDWFEKFRDGVEAVAEAEPRKLEAEIHAGIAFSEAIRYIQIGKPERITVGSRELVEAFFPFMAGRGEDGEPEAS